MFLPLNKLNNPFPHAVKDFFIILLIHAYSLSLTGQDAPWTLEECIQYAEMHNFSVQKSVLDERVAEMRWEQSRLSQLPNVSLSASYGRSFGRSINPTSNQFENTEYDFSGVNGSGNVLLFGWFQKRNTIARDKMLHQASQAAQEQLQEDISLNVATGFLRVLLARDQVALNEKKISFSQKKLEQTTILLESGRSNGLDLSQMETQLIVDSSAYLKSVLEYQNALIDLRALLNLSLKAPFEPASYPNSDIPFEKLQDNGPEKIYALARQHLGQIRESALRIKAAQKSLHIVKGALYPSISLNFSSGTNYSSSFYELLPNGELALMPWGKQLRNNLSQTVSLGISIPLFSGLASQYAIKEAKINLLRSNIDQQEALSGLEQDVHKAWNDVQTALQTYNAAKSAVRTAEKAHYFAEQRYKKGLINASDLMIAQNDYFQILSEENGARYELIFKIKVLDYYTGSD